MVIARFCAIASLFFWKMSLFPAFKQGGKLRIPPNSPAAPPRPRTGPGDALQLLCPEVLQFEEIAEKFSRGLGNDHHVRLGDPLQACR